MSKRLVVEYTGFKSGSRLIKSERKLKRALRLKKDLFQRIPDRFVFTVLEGMEIVKEYFPKYRRLSSDTISKSVLKELMHVSRNTDKFEVFLINSAELELEKKKSETNI
jgi:hypothetical protein